MFSAFANRKPWACALLSFFLGPMTGMFFLGSGVAGLAYFFGVYAAYFLPFAVAHFGLYPWDPLDLGNTLFSAIWASGAVGCYYVAKDRQGRIPSQWFARWYNIIAIYLAVIWMVAFFIRSFLWEPFNIPSGSMKPTLEIGDYLFISKTAYGYSRHSLPLGLPLFEGRIFAAEPERGDIVIYKGSYDGSDNKIDFIRRIAGLPGDKIQIQNGRLYINDVQIRRQRVSDYVEQRRLGEVNRISRYIETLPEGRSYEILEDKGDNGIADNTKVFTVPEGHYFGLGDNRDNSMDSRFADAGFIPFENLLGRFEVVFWNSKTRKLMFERRD